MEKDVNDKEVVGYKVVRRVGRKWESCTSAGLAVTYLVGRWVKPRIWGGPLTVFRDDRLAIGFSHKIIRDNPSAEVAVYRCLYFPTKVEHVWRYRISMGGLIQKSASSLPEETTLAKRIKITKRVY